MHQEPNPKSLILIPGPWENHTDIVVSIAKPLEYIFAGMLLGKMGGDGYFKAWLVESWTQEDYKEVFSLLFADDSNGQLLQACKSVFVIEMEETGVEYLTKLSHAISAVLKAGGFGVKIPSCGKIIKKEAWDQLKFEPVEIIELFMSIYDTGKGVVTCGMGNFAERDVFAPLTFDDDAYHLLRVFASYKILEKPVLNQGETFSLNEEDTPYFKLLQTEDDVRKDPEHPYYNSLGLWKLWPLEWLKNDKSIPK